MFAPEPHVPHIPFVLADGTRIYLRPVVPEDLPRLKAGAEKLSPESLFTRFNMGFGQLSDSILKRLVDADQEAHIAWGCLLVDDLNYPGVGIAHMIQLPEEPGAAELAITVADEYQNRGLGSLLLALMYLLAPSKGIHTLRAILSVENGRYIDRIKELGAKVRFADQHYELSWEVKEKNLPQNPRAIRFIHLIQDLKRAFSQAKVEI